MARVSFTAAFVFLFMAFLAAQAGTGFMRDLFAGGAYPRALRAFDRIIATFFTGPFGNAGGAAALMLLGAIFAALILRRGIKGTKPQEGDAAPGRRANLISTVATPISREVSAGDRRAEGARAWISGVFHPDGLSYRRGARTKFYNHDWEPASADIPDVPDEVYAAYRRHRHGYALQRSEFPEALALFDPKRFASERDWFYAGPFVAVKGELADLLSRFNLGDGGLVPFTIYEADLVTPHPGEFFLLNFGARKNSLLPEQSDNVKKFSIHHKTGFQFWDINSWRKDGDVALSQDALEGPDLWFEEKVTDELFMSDALAKALVGIGMGDVFRLKECRVLQGG